MKRLVAVGGVVVVVLGLVVYFSYDSRLDRPSFEVWQRMELAERRQVVERACSLETTDVRVEGKDLVCSLVFHNRGAVPEWCSVYTFAYWKRAGARDAQRVRYSAQLFTLGRPAASEDDRRPQGRSASTVDNYNWKLGTGPMEPGTYLAWVQISEVFRVGPDQAASLFFDDAFAQKLRDSGQVIPVDIRSGSIVLTVDAKGQRSVGSAVPR